MVSLRKFARNLFQNCHFSDSHETRALYQEAQLPSLDTRFSYRETRLSSREKQEKTGNSLLSSTVYLETVDRRETPWICNSHLFLSSYLFFFFKNALFYNTNPLPEKNSATFSTVADQGNPRARTTYSLVSSFMLSGLACKSKIINLTNDVLVTWSISQEFCLT